MTRPEKEEACHPSVLRRLVPPAWAAEPRAGADAEGEGAA